MSEYCRLEQSITGTRVAAAWSEAIADIAQLEVYGGWQLTPQVGMVPLRRDPRSGLWEFWLIVSGPRPKPNTEEEAVNPWILPEGAGVVFVLIPAGEFLMGSPESERGRDGGETQHRVRISQPFYMGKYEVTQAQWQAVMGSNPSNLKGGGNLPVDMVSWDDCQEFCKKLSAKTGKAVRLPTEAEWEYACRAGSTGKYSFGDDESQLGRYAWYSESSGLETHPVGGKQANTWGLYDMHGNVWEWCADWYDKYPGSSATSDFFGQANRVLRGGSWSNVPADCRSASRSWVGPDSRHDVIALRVAVGTK